jgi:glycosyltransferase involved in cell wall biosynthesis
LTFHEGKNVAAARNVCARTATQDLIINVDDDVYVEPDALAALVAAYGAGDGPRVVAGSVAWNNVWSQPIVMRPIGYGRSATTGETPSFLIGAFFLYPRVFALTWPWNENIRTSDDRFMGALWRSRKVKLLFESQARAIHDSEHTSYNARDHHDHIYANLYDAVIANPNLTRALSYEFVGFLCGLRRFLKQPAQARSYISAWVSGNLSFLSDWSMLHALTDRPTPLHSTHSELGHRLG